MGMPTGMGSGQQGKNRKRETSFRLEKGMLPWAWRMFHPFHGEILLLCAGAAALSLLQVGLAVLSRFVIDSGVQGDMGFRWWATGMLAVIVLLVLVRGGLSWLSGRLTDRSAAKLRYELLAAVERSSSGDLQAYHSGTILNRANEDVEVLCNGMSSLLPGQIGNGTRLLLAFTAVALFSPVIAWVLLAAGLLAGAGMVCVRPVLKRRYQNVRQTEEASSARLQESVQQIETIKGLGAEKETLRRFGGALRRELEAKRRWRAFSVGGGMCISAAVQLGTGCMMMWGALGIHRGILTYGTLAALLQLLSLFRGPVMGLTGLWSQLAAMETAADSLRELLELGRDEPSSGAEEAFARVTAAVFENVSFRYPGDETPVLEHFSARFDLTDWTCLTGMSGRGKTTVLKLLLGFYRPQCGRVYLETEQGTRLCGPDTRKVFAYVPQNYALFSGSVLDNLLLAAPGASEQEWRKALDVAQAGFVWELEEQERTQLRENNTGLSQGQLQRLAIARAVLMRRPALLLDECTSALDAETERAVLNALRGLRTGAVLITHHPERLEDMAERRDFSMEEQG